MQLAGIERRMGIAAVSIIGSILLSGCQKRNGLEQFANTLTGAKTIRMEATLKSPSGTRNVQTTRKLPDFAKTVSEEMVSIAGPTEGFVELDTNLKKYNLFPWLGKFLPSLNKLVPEHITSCVVAYGASPLLINSIKNWKLKKEGGREYWQTELITPTGAKRYEVEIGSDGKLKRYLGPEGEFTVTKWELNGEVADSEFSWPIPDGYVKLHLPVEPMDLYYGQKIDFTKFTSNNKRKPGNGWSLVVFNDPQDSISQAHAAWFEKSSFDASKVVVSLGSGGDFTAADEGVFWKLVSATPTCVLINKNGEVRAMWQGFDPTQTARLEKEISEAIKEHA